MRFALIVYNKNREWESKDISWRLAEFFVSVLTTVTITVQSACYDAKLTEVGFPFAVRAVTATATYYERERAAQLQGFTPFARQEMPQGFEGPFQEEARQAEAQVVSAERSPPLEAQGIRRVLAADRREAELLRSRESASSALLYSLLALYFILLLQVRV